MKDLLDLGLPEAVIDILREDGITELYPPQVEAMPIALRGENLVLAVPTASGKSLVAYLAVVKAALEGGKALYIVPLRALASEKYDDLKRFERLGIRVGLSIGDFDSPDIGLKRYDILISTSEKADSLLRHKSDWLNIIKVIVADEVHLINDPGRGPTLEVILSRFKQINKAAQIVALSATVSNAREMAEWLDARLVTSEWRPVKLRPGVFYDGEVHFSDGKVEEARSTVEGLITQSIEGGGQCLVFVSSRKYCESLAARLCNMVEKKLDEKDLEELAKGSKRFVKGTVEPTAFGRRLADFVSHGVSFHHAGLRHDQRKLVEELFKKRLIKVIVATPTLAAGINLPARRVIVRDPKRWSGQLGTMDYIPVMEIKQMIGRAGRPRYDTEGEGIVVARNHWEVDHLLDNFIRGESEEVESKLGTESALRSHILSSIATGYCGSMEEITEFINTTFFAHQRETWRIHDIIEGVVDFLLENDLVISGAEGGLRATFFGKRVSDLYIDPSSALVLRKGLELAKERGRTKRPTVFSYLSAICATPDMERVMGYLRQTERPFLEKILENKRAELLFPAEELSEEELLAQMKVASLINDWINERPEDGMVEFYNIGPGDIRVRVETGEWMLYSMGQLARVFETGLEDEILQISRRIRYGIKEELLDLCQLRGVARVRARALFKKGFKNRDDIRKLGNKGVDVLAKIPSIGKALATSIVDQLSGKGKDHADEGTPDSRLEDYIG